jgi:hypothetical protein
MKFDLVKNINLSNKETWSEKLFLTLDIDWVSDEVLSFAIDLVEKYNLPATWFVTHETKLLDRIRENPLFELGIHPNYNFLLDGDFRNGKSINEIIDNMFKIVPDAVSVRSHSLTYSSKIMEAYASKGLKYECSYYIDTNGMNVPWLHPSGLIHVPHIWEDDVAFLGEQFNNLEMKTLMSGIKVFDFHPFHLFLNSDSLSMYNDNKANYKNAEELLKNRNKSYGTYDRFVFLAGLATNFNKKL